MKRNVERKNRKTKTFFENKLDMGKLDANNPYKRKAF